MENPRKITLVGDRHEAVKKFGQGQALLRATNMISEFLGLSFYRLFSADKTVQAQSIRGVQDQITLSAEEAIPIEEEEEEMFLRGAFGMIASGHPESGKVYFRCENQNYNFFIDVKEIEGGSTIQTFYFISGLYDCFDIGCIGYQVAWPNVKVLKYRIIGLDRNTKVTWTHPPYNFAGGPNPNTSTYYKALLTHEVVEIVAQDPYFNVSPTDYQTNSVYGGFSISSYNHGPSDDGDGHTYVVPKVCVVWFEKPTPPDTFFDGLKFHIVGSMRWIEQITGTMHGVSKILKWVHLRWFYHEGQTNYWFVLPDSNEVNLQIVITGADGTPEHYYYGMGSEDHTSDVTGIAWIILRETSWDWWDNLHYEQLVNEHHVFPVLNKTYKGIRGYTHLYATHEADFNTPGESRTVSERTRTVYSLNSPSYVLKKTTYNRSHPYQETNYAANWTVYILGHLSAASIRNPWGGGIEGRFSCADQWVGLKMKTYDDPWCVRVYDYLKGLYIIDEIVGDVATPKIYGIQEGSSPPISEPILASYFGNAYPFGQINKIGGGRELLGPKKFEILSYTPVCLMIPNLAYNAEQGPITIVGWSGLAPEVFDFTLKGKKGNSQTGFPMDMLSWQFYKFAENYGILPLNRDTNTDKRFQ